MRSCMQGLHWETTTAADAHGSEELPLSDATYGKNVPTAGFLVSWLKWQRYLSNRISSVDGKRLTHKRKVAAEVFLLLHFIGCRCRFFNPFFLCGKKRSFGKSTFLPHNGVIFMIIHNATTGVHRFPCFQGLARLSLHQGVSGGWGYRKKKS